jgi:hypothetical protein
VSSARGLPDQNEAKRAQNGAVSRPLDLIDHEACLRPGNHAGPLTDPQKTDGKREQAHDQKRSAHDFFLPSPSRFGRVAFFMMAAETFAMGNRSFRSIATPVRRAELRSPTAAPACPALPGPASAAQKGWLIARRAQAITEQNWSTIETHLRSAYQQFKMRIGS